MSLEPSITVRKTSTQLILTIKMRQKYLQPAATPEETASIPPPKVDWGAHVTFFTLPSSLNGKTIAKSIHSNLINAVSEPIRKHHHNTKEYGDNPIDLSEMISGITTEVFELLIKWLYTGQILITPPSAFSADLFWALAFRMSEVLQISAVQLIAFEKFAACLSPTTSLSTGRIRADKPSAQLLDVLFQPGDCEGILQSWVVDHIHWIYECVPSALDDVAASMRLYPLMAAEVCVRLFHRKFKVHI